MLSVKLAPEGEGVLAMYPGQLIDELQSAVVDCERSVVGVADPGEPSPVKHHVRNSPSDRVSGVLTRDSDLGNNVVGEGREGAERVKELGVAEAGLVDDVGSKSPRI